MPATTVTVNRDQVLLSLGQLSSTVADREGALRVVGSLMQASVMRTFREEGSPAGSWPGLAASTRKKKGYTAGHKLLVLTGRLRNSITYWIENGQLTIGTNVVYAAVQQYGSADRLGGSIGAQAKIPGRESRVSAYDSMRAIPFRRFGRDQRTGKDGKARSVRVREQGPANARKVHTQAHGRHQNIPARPFLVIRPEDPGRFVSGIEAYLRGSKAVSR